VELLHLDGQFSYGYRISRYWWTVI